MPIETALLDKLTGRDNSEGVPPLCIACGYNLTGAVSSRCPECGRAIVRSEFKRQAAELRARLVELETLTERASIGLKVGAIGLVLRSAGLAFGLWGVDWVASLSRLPAVLFGFAAVCLGLSIFRIHRVPPWARAMLSNPPNYLLALGAIIMGLLAVASSIVTL